MKAVIAIALSIGVSGAALASYTRSTNFEVRASRQRLVTGGNIPIIGGQAVFLDNVGQLSCERNKCTVVVLAFLVKGQNACFNLYALVDGTAIEPDEPQCGVTGTAFQSAFSIPKGTHYFQTQFKLSDDAGADTIYTYQITYTVYDRGTP